MTAPFPRQPMAAALLACALLLGACGGQEDKAGNSVTMRDMEVVDGTINDAMTDLDGAAPDGTAMIGNGAADAGNSAEAKKPAAGTKSADDVPADAEVVDQ